jgi:hypothetical protein
VAAATALLVTETLGHSASCQKGVELKPFSKGSFDVLAGKHRNMHARLAVPPGSSAEHEQPER